jgi:hypothetical protein
MTACEVPQGHFDVDSNHARGYACICIATGCLGSSLQVRLQVLKSCHDALRCRCLDFNARASTVGHQTT